ncbi:S8 family serine peptidase [Nostoc sp.]|uniref:S8 family serine peptidase n=1 Tax=Nostoc sp. TaxID=1180 RepID=UPI002FF96DBC
MKRSNFLFKKDSADNGSKRNNKKQNTPQIKAFILEPILTPSGVFDGGDDIPDPLLLNINQVEDTFDTPVHHVEALDIDLNHSITDIEFSDADLEPVEFFTAENSDIVIAVANPEPTFDSGVFTVGETGEVEIDFLFDGGGYKGELAIFSLDGIDGFEPGSQEFIQEAAQRALSSSELGHVVIFDSTEGARFSANLNWEANFNSGEYQGVKTFSMRPGDEFGFMLVPNGRVEQVFNNPGVDGAVRPLFSLATANPNDAFHVGQIADVTGDGNTFALEDLRLDVRSDKDYNDIVFQVRGATGKAELLDDVINSGRDWRDTEIGKALVDYAEAYVMPDANDLDIIDYPSDGNLDINPEPVDDFTGNEIADFDLTDVTVVEIPDATEEIEIVDSSVISQFEFPKADQPLVGIIDTGFSGDNPDIDYSRIILGQDRVNGDANPLLASGEGNEHGTHVLGVIAATQNNDVGIDGINDDAPVWVGRAIGSGKWADSLVEFVDAAKVSGQPNAVVNLSLDLTQVNPDGSVTTRYEFTPAERTAIEYARQNGVLIVVASGNDGGVMSALGQASQEFDNIITVGAADGLDRADYSSYGDGLDILAAGGTNEKPIVSSTGDGVGAMAGTSVAAAKVTGAASQVWAANPQLSYRQVIEIIKSTATDLKTPGWDAETGAGLLNIAVAVSVAGKTTPEVYNPAAFLTPTTWGGEGKVTPSERAVSVEFNGKYYDWDAYKIRAGDTLSGIALRTMGNGTAPYYNFIAQRNGIANPNRIYAGQTIYVPRQVSAPTVNLNNTVNYQPAPPTTSTTINGYRVDGNFYPVYTNYRGTLGNPISGVINYSNGVTYQLFERGSIVSSQYGTYPIYGGIRQTYLNTSGLNGWLGAPKSAEIGQGNGVVIQYFANGYIIWNGSRATAYRNGSGTPSQPVPTPKPDNNIKLKNFRGWVMPGIGVALRNSPHLNDKSGKAEPYGKWLEFDAWTYGDTVKDYKVGTPDNRWFRVKGTNYWVPSAYIYGYPEGLPGNETPGSSGSGTNNNQPITSYADYLKRLYGGNGVITSYPSSAHNAIDSVNQGQYPYKVYALTSGVVKYIGKDQYGGNYVQIWNPELQRYFYYVHFAGFNPTLKVGQQIKAGDYIGNEGSTGKATGRHTHVHVTLPDGKTKVDPLSALGKNSGTSGGDNDKDNKIDLPIGNDLDFPISIPSRPLLTSIYLLNGLYLVEGEYNMQGRAHVIYNDNAPIVLGNQDILKIQNFFTNIANQFGVKIDKDGRVSFQIGNDSIAADFSINPGYYQGKIDLGVEQTIIKYPFNDDLSLQITVKHSFDGRYHRKIERSSAQEKVAEFIKIIVASGENQEEAYRIFLEKNPDVEDWIGGIAKNIGIFVNGAAIALAVVGIVLAAAAIMFGALIPGDEVLWIAAINALVKFVTARLGIA